MKKIYLALMCAASVALVAACGGNSGKSGQAAENEVNAEETSGEKKTEAAVEENASEPEQIAEEKVEPKKWYENDFVLKEKMYVGTQSITRIYARKGTVVIGTSEGSPTTTLFECTDSTRAEYLIGDKGTYGFIKEKDGFTSVDDAIYKYLKSQMSNTVFGDKLKIDDPDCVVKDTVIFGRPAYIITKEQTEKNIAAEVYGKTIVWRDKENGLPYYKYGLVKNGDRVITDGPVFEVLEFSLNPTYEGLTISLDGLERIN